MKVYEYNINNKTKLEVKKAASQLTNNLKGIITRALPER
jgi:hypothetical protein